MSKIKVWRHSRNNLQHSLKVPGQPLILRDILWPRWPSLGRLLRRGWTLGELFVDRHRNTGSPCLLLVPVQIKPTGMTTYLIQSNRGPKMLVLLGAGPDLSDSGGCDWAACCRSRFRADPGPGPSFPPSCLEFTHLYGSIATSPASDAAGFQQ